MRITRPDLKYNISRLLPAFIILIIFFVVQHYFFAPTDLCLYPGYFGDHLFYSDVIYSLDQFGNENTLRAENLISQHHSVSPYHYWDLWFNIIPLKIANVAPILSYYIIFIPLFSLLVILGSMGFLQKTYGNTFKYEHYTLALLLLFISGIDFWESKPDFLNTLSKFSGSVFGYPKLLITMIIILWSYINNNTKNTFYILVISTALFSISNIAHLPGAIGALFIMLIYRKQFNGHFITSIALIIGITALYLFLGSAFTGQEIQLGWDSIKTKINLFIGEILAVGYYHFIFFLPLLNGNIRRQIWQFIIVNKDISLFYTLFLIFSWIFSVLLSDLSNSYQFLSNIIIPIINISVLIVWIFAIETFKPKWLLYGLLLVYIGFRTNRTISGYLNKNIIWCNYYSYEYVKTVKDELKDMPNKVGGVILANHKERNDLGVYQFNYAGYYLSTFDEGYQLLNLSAPFLAKQYEKGSYYNLAYESSLVTRDLENSMLSYDEFLLNYIQDKEIEFLIVEHGADVPNNVSAIVKNQIKDNNSGELFLIIN